MTFENTTYDWKHVVHTPQQNALFHSLSSSSAFERATVVVEEDDDEYIIIIIIIIIMESSSNTGQNQSQRPPPPTLAHKKLPPEVNRILYVRNLPFGITDEDVYDIFGKYGAIRQIRVGNTRSTKGTAYVVYEDIYDAKAALEKLSGFNVANRYLIVLYYKNTNTKNTNNAVLAREEAALKALQKREGVSGEQQK